MVFGKTHGSFIPLYPLLHIKTAQSCSASAEERRRSGAKGQLGGQAAASLAELCSDTHLVLAQKLASHFQVN